MVNETIPKKILNKLQNSSFTKADAIGYGSASVGTSATAIVGLQSTRTAMIIVNNSSVTVYLGGPSVTTSNGIPLAQGEVYSNTNWTGAVHGIVSSGSADVRYQDFHD